MVSRMSAHPNKALATNNGAVPEENASGHEGALPGYSDANKLLDKLFARYGELSAEAAHDPLKNPVQALAVEFGQSLLSDKAAGSSLGQLVELIGARAIMGRASRMARYLETVPREQNDSKLRQVIHRQAHDAQGKSLPFERFHAAISRASYGLVLTAHPTFLLPAEKWGSFASLVEHFGGEHSLGEADMTRALQELAVGRKGWEHGIGLAEEHELSLRTLASIQDAMHRFLGLVFDVAAELYPDEWRVLVAQPLTLASWVGYDLDGRSDIRWSDTLKARLIVQQRQIERYLTALSDLREQAGGKAGNRRADTILKLLESRLVLARHVVSDDLARIPDKADDVEAVQALGRSVNQHGENRLTGTAELIELLGEALAEQPEDALARGIAILRSEITIYGLGMAHTHVRLNATQIMNALRGEIEGDAELGLRSGRRQRARLVGELLDQVKAESISFGTVLYERTSAKRLFMLVTQMLKHVDGSAPVRFLIAECEEASTVLAALYFARQFGIDDRLDISPLFETEAALQRGDAMLSELLESEHYRTYIRKRGRLCIQTGFSDAGRYLGQVAASLAIERLRIKLGRLLAAEGLHDVELLIFDTHGESIGRGAHPGSFSARLDHVFPPANRAYFRYLGITVKQETSFQGGDGFMFFASPALAYASVARLLEHGLNNVGPEPGRAGKMPMQARHLTSLGDAGRDGEIAGIQQVTSDAFYLDTEYSLDFFINLADFSNRLAEDPSYAALLGMFGANLLYPTGSRAVKRQHEKGAHADLSSVSQIRAIPHNAVLQQMGYLANSCGGIGHAIRRDQERFWDVLGRSDRCRQFMALVAEAFDRSDLDAFVAYVALTSPSMWLQQAMQDEQHATSFEALANLFQATGRYGRVWPAAQTLLHDALSLRQALKTCAEQDDGEVASGYDRSLLPIIHAVRLALIHVIFVLVTRIPRFTSQPDVTLEEVREQLLRLDVEGALNALRRAFPAQVAQLGSQDFGEAATYRSDSQQGYDQEHRAIFDPLGQYYGLLRQLSCAIANDLGAVG